MRISAIIFEVLNVQIELIEKKPWQTLIILDSCRYDVLVELNPLPYMRFAVLKTEPHNAKTFYKCLPKLKDVTLVTANPAPFLVNADEKFKEVILTRSIYPHDNIREALNVDGRVMLHLMPPHVPPLFEFGYQLWQRFLSEKNYEANEHAKSIKRNFGPDGADGQFFKWLEWKGISANAIYSLNLLEGLKAIGCYFEEFKRPLVITTDHGFLLGEGNYWGHSENINHPALRIVPWIWIEK